MNKLESKIKIIFLKSWASNFSHHQKKMAAFEELKRFIHFQEFAEPSGEFTMTAYLTALQLWSAAQVAMMKLPCLKPEGMSEENWKELREKAREDELVKIKIEDDKFVFYMPNAYNEIITSFIFQSNTPIKHRCKMMGQCTDNPVCPWLNDYVHYLNDHHGPNLPIQHFDMSIVTQSFDIPKYVAKHRDFIICQESEHWLKTFTVEFFWRAFLRYAHPLDFFKCRQPKSEHHHQIRELMPYNEAIETACEETALLFID